MNDLKAAAHMLQMSISVSKQYKDKKVVLFPMEAAQTILAALCDAQARQEGCEMCNEEKRITLEVFADNTNKRLLMVWENYKPNYCPSCGRHLEPVGNPDMLPGASDPQVKNTSQDKQNDIDTPKPSSYQQVKEARE